MVIRLSTSRRPSAEAVLRLYRFAHWAKERKIESIRLMLRHSPLIASAWDGKILVGMARCNSDFAYRAVLWDVIVDPSYTLQGLGSRMLHLILKHPSLRRVESVWLSTTDKHDFYARFGFERNTQNIMVLKRQKKRR